MNKQTINHDELTFDIVFGDIARSIRVPANTLQTEMMVTDSKPIETIVSFPDHNPEDYSYGLFTEK